MQFLAIVHDNAIESNAVIDSVQFNPSAIAMTAVRNANVSGWECDESFLDNRSDVNLSLAFYFSIQRSKLVIYFEDLADWDRTTKRILYNYSSLFHLWLFMGISVLRIIEILCYSSVRWYWILRRPTSETNSTHSTLIMCEHLIALCLFSVVLTLFSIVWKSN